MNTNRISSILFASLLLAGCTTTFDAVNPAAPIVPAPPPPRPPMSLPGSLPDPAGETGSNAFPAQPSRAPGS